MKRSKMSDQSPVKKKKKGNADGTAICVIHVAANAKDKVSGFTEQSCRKAAVIKVILVNLDLVFKHICFTAGTRFFVLYFQ